MHDHISIAYNSKRSTGMKLILVSFESYMIEDCLFQEAFPYLHIWYGLVYHFKYKGILTQK